MSRPPPPKPEDFAVIDAMLRHLTLMVASVKLMQPDFEELLREATLVKFAGPVVAPELHASEYNEEMQKHWPPLINAALAFAATAEPHLRYVLGDQADRIEAIFENLAEMEPRMRVKAVEHFIRYLEDDDE